MKSIKNKNPGKGNVYRDEPHPLAPYPPLLINACLVGSVPRKEQTPHVPVTPDEIIEDAVKVYDAGARIVHIHAREDDGTPTWKGKIYEKILGGIRRERPDLICCVTTSGRRWPEFERRIEVLQLEGDSRPDMASLTLGSMNFPGGASVSDIETIERLLEFMNDKGIRPELEAFDVGMVALSRFLDRKGLLPERKYFNLLLGNLGSIPASIGNLDAMVRALPENSTWAAAGIGMFQLPMNMAAMIAGGGVRVGIEDSIYLDISRTKLATNEALVRRIVDMGKQLELEVATPRLAGEMTGVI